MEEEKIPEINGGNIMGKRLKISFLATLLVVCTFSAETFCEEGIKVSINGESVQMNQNPVIVNGRTLVPLRTIFEALGVKPVWDEKSRTVSATNGTVNMSLALGDSKAVVNGKIVNMDVPGTLINNSTMVPARFIAETLGANVEWDQETKTVLIHSSDIQSSNKLSSSNVAENDPMSNLVLDANDEIKISVNGTNVVMSEPPVIVKGKILVPIRSILAALGVTGSWNDPQKTLTVNNDVVNMRLVIGEETATVNEKIVQLEAPGAIINSSALIPVRFIAETMGAQVDWNQETKTIQIKSKRAPILPANSLKIESGSTAEPFVAGFKCSEWTSTSIRLIGDSRLDFSITNGDTWQSSPLFEGLTPSTQYKIIARWKSDQLSPKPLAKSKLLNGQIVFTTPSEDYSSIEGPQRPKGIDSTATSITLESNPLFEYSIDDGKAWQESPVFSGLKPSTTYNFVARYKSTSTSLASRKSNSVTDITTQANDYDSNVPNRPQGVSASPTSITLESNPLLEYSFDNGLSWQESPIFSGLTPSTTYDFVSRYKATSTSPASGKSRGVTDITTPAH